MNFPPYNAGQIMAWLRFTLLLAAGTAFAAMAVG